MSIPFAPLDLVAFGWFLLCWIGFTLTVNRPMFGRLSINQSMLVHRQDWMRRMIDRDNRITDAALMTAVMGSASFLASTTLVVVAALLGMLGAMDKVYAVVLDLPLGAAGTRQAWEAKVILLVIVFVYAFFKFTWAIRMWNYCCVLVGATPAPPVREAEAAGIAHRAGYVAHQATSSFNGGLRAYYFGLAMLAWFFHPVAFMAATAWVVAVLCWRQYYSPTARLLRVPCAAYEARRRIAPPE